VSVGEHRDHRPPVGPAAAAVFEGRVEEDRNLPGHLLLVEPSGAMYSFARADVAGEDEVGGGRSRVWVRRGATAFRTESFQVGAEDVLLRPDMENVAPPLVFVGPAAPAPLVARALEEFLPPPPSDPAPDAPARADARSALVGLLAPPLSAIAANWMDSCQGGDAYANNCAHYLSDAFLRAGFIDLLAPNPYINARCGTAARRPIRARDMWAWFQSKAVATSRSLTAGTGWWAVFQLDESVYWGGHVAVWDSDANVYYGTGWYSGWGQYLYQW
jgi:hypothetical protein